MHPKSTFFQHFEENTTRYLNLYRPLQIHVLQSTDLPDGFSSVVSVLLGDSRWRGQYNTLSNGQTVNASPAELGDLPFVLAMEKQSSHHL